MPTPADNPIEILADDALGRAEFAAELAQQMRAVDATKGYVFGLLGPWGSGKTSLINLVKAELAGQPVLTVVDFNPWMFSGADALIELFLHELSAQLRLKDPRRFNKIADQVDRYGQLLTPLVWVPGIGGTAGRLKSLAGLAKVLQRERGSVEQQKRDLSQALSQLSSPIVVVIDDVDRLSQREVQDIFKLVRLTASLPNVIYLVAFDRDRVERALDDAGMPGRSYLEKIVQTGWDVPAVPSQILLNQLAENLQSMINDVGDVKLFDDDRWPDLLFEVILPLVVSMRDVRRYVASASVTVRGLAEKVELVDVLALEAIRVFLPDIFAMLAELQEALTTSFSGYGSTHEQPSLKHGIETLLTESGDRRPLVEDLLRRLFPASVRHFENNSYGSDWKAVWLKARRVAHPDVLSLYLERTMSLRMNAFDDAEKALGLMVDQETFEAFLLSLPRRRVAGVITALETFEGEFPSAGVVPGATTLLDIMPGLEVPEANSMFTLDASMIVRRVVLRLLRTLDGPDAVASAVQTILAMTVSLTAQEELILLVGHREHAGSRLVDEATAKQFESAFIAKLQEMDLSTLQPGENLVRLLLAPKYFGGEIMHVNTDEPATLHLSIFLSAASAIRSQGVGNRKVTQTPMLSWEVLTSAYGSEEAIGQALGKIDVAKLDGATEVVALARKYLSGWRPDSD